MLFLITQLLNFKGGVRSLQGLWSVHKQNSSCQAGCYHPTIPSKLFRNAFVLFEWSILDAPYLLTTQLHVWPHIGMSCQGCQGNRKNGPIHLVPLKRCRYTNTEWHAERWQVVAEHTGSLCGPMRRAVQRAYEAFKMVEALVSLSD